MSYMVISGRQIFDAVMRFRDDVEAERSGPVRLSVRKIAMESPRYQRMLFRGEPAYLVGVR